MTTKGKKKKNDKGTLPPGFLSQRCTDDDGEYHSSNFQRLMMLTADSRFCRSGS
jgi:hypothetical protein